MCLLRTLFLALADMQPGCLSGSPPGLPAIILVASWVLRCHKVERKVQVPPLGSVGVGTQDCDLLCVDHKHVALSSSFRPCLGMGSYLRPCQSTVFSLSQPCSSPPKHKVSFSLDCITLFSCCCNTLTKVT